MDTSKMVLAAVSHLKELGELLRQAAESSPSLYHERKLRRLAFGFEGIVEPLECIASGLDADRCSSPAGDQLDGGYAVAAEAVESSPGASQVNL